MRRDRQRLEDILEAIERIEKYASGGRATFDRDELVQTWVLHHLQIIGEAVRGLSDEIRSAHPDIPWAQICHAGSESIDFSSEVMRRGRSSSTVCQTMSRSTSS